MWVYRYSVGGILHGVVYEKCVFWCGRGGFPSQCNLAAYKVMMAQIQSLDSSILCCCQAWWYWCQVWQGPLTNATSAGAMFPSKPGSTSIIAQKIALITQWPTYAKGVSVKICLIAKKKKIYRLSHRLELWIQLRSCAAIWCKWSSMWSCRSGLMKNK